MMNNIRLSFTLFLRNIRKKKIPAFIVLSSISVGLFVSIILFGFIQREQGTDTFFVDSSNTFRLLSNDPFADSGTLSYLTKSVAEYIKKYPEIASVSRVSELTREGVPLINDNQVLERNMVVAVDKSFTDVFELPGNKYRRITINENSIVLRKNLAAKLFGDKNPVGRNLVLKYDTLQFLLVVSDVLSFDNKNTHFEFDALVDFSLFESYLSGASIYLNLAQNADKRSLENKLSTDLSMPSLVGPGKCNYFFQELSEVYFDVNNKRRFIKTRNPDFIFVSWIIILLVSIISIFNFINLHALSLFDRQKEFGLKKVAGASFLKISMAVGFEVFLYLTSGLIVAGLLLIFFIPIFNALLQTELSLRYFLNSHVLIAIVIFFVILILAVSGIMSYLTQRIKPVRLINGLDKNGFKVNKIFFASQFFISSALIFCATIVIKQVRHIESKPLGFDRDVVEMRLPRGASKTKMKLLKEEIIKFGHIDKKRVSVTSGNPISGNRIIRYDLGDGEFYAPYFMEGDEDLITALGLKTEIGSQTNTKTGKIVNKRLVTFFNLKDPIGEVIPGSKDDRIVSVVNDFNVSSLKSEIPLYILGYNQEGSMVLLNFKGIDFEELKGLLRTIWNSVFPDSPFHYSLLNDQLLGKHRSDLFLSKLTAAFAFLSILISSFGLYSLAKSECQNRQKEIAIRKCLGAPLVSIAHLLFFDFGKWIFFSFTTASIAANFIVRYWLDSFASHTEINWVPYVTTALSVFVLSGIALSNETIKASIRNPISFLHGKT